MEWLYRTKTEIMCDNTEFANSEIGMRKDKGAIKSFGIKAGQR